MIAPNAPAKLELIITALLIFGVKVEADPEAGEDEAGVETETAEVDLDEDAAVDGDATDEAAGDGGGDAGDSDGGVYWSLTSYLKQKIMNVYFMLIIKKVFLKWYKNLP